MSFHNPNLRLSSTRCYHYGVGSILLWFSCMFDPTCSSWYLRKKVIAPLLRNFDFIKIASYDSFSYLMIQESTNWSISQIFFNSNYPENSSNFFRYFVKNNTFDKRWQSMIVESFVIIYFSMIFLMRRIYHECLKKEW